MVHAASCLCSQVSAECVQQIIQADLALTPAQTQHATTCRFKVFLELKQRQHFLNIITVLKSLQILTFLNLWFRGRYLGCGAS